jgi:hypothetical protein
MPLVRVALRYVVVTQHVVFKPQETLTVAVTVQPVRFGTGKEAQRRAGSACSFHHDSYRWEDTSSQKGGAPPQPPANGATLFVFSPALRAENTRLLFVPTNLPGWRDRSCGERVARAHSSAYGIMW